MTRHRKSKSLRVASSAENSHVVGVLAREAHGIDRRLEALLARHAQLGLQVQVGGGDERVDAPLRRRLDRPRGRLEVGAMAARQAGDHRPPDLGGNLAHGFGVGRRRDREAGLDDVHAERIELTRQLQLLGRAQRKPGRLLAVAQRRVEDPDVLFVHRTPWKDVPPYASRRDRPR